MANVTKGYAKFYLSQPLRIDETMCAMSSCPLVRDVSWRKKGKHYSPSVPVFSWEGRGGHVFKFEMGSQWGDKRDILVVGHLL